MKFHFPSSILPFTWNSPVLFVIPIVLLTFLVFSPAINNGFLNWDDNVYVTQNDYIKDTSLSGLNKLLFSKQLHIGDNNRVSLLSFALIYKFGGMNPHVYHAVNVIFHLLNTVLVFYFVLLLFKRIELSVITALFFAIHPMHIESVAWVSELKDVQYTFFFLCSLLCYLVYLKKGFKFYYLLISLLLFFLSLKSKIAAASLPFLLILIDYYFKRKFNTKLLLEKLLFFLCLLFVTIIPLLTARKPSVETLRDIPHPEIFFSFFDRLLLAAYTIVFYVIKFFAPFNLSFLYPYPDKTDGMLPTEYYVALFFLPWIMFLILCGIHKAKKCRSELLFGFLFFLINISLYAHIIPIKGVVVVAERYTYTAYIGLLIVVGHFYCLAADGKILHKYKGKTVLLSIFILFAFYCSIVSWNRCKVWKNDLTLFSDVIAKNPNYAFAYLNRGNFKKETRDVQGALADYNKAIALDTAAPYGYNNRGILKAETQDFEGAITDYDKAIELNPRYIDAYSNRGDAKKVLKDYQGMIKDYDKAVELKPKYAPVYNNRGTAKYTMKDYQGALKDYSKAIELTPNHWEMYNNRGNIRKLLNDFDGALEDFSKAIALHPDSWEIYNNRGSVKNKLQKYQDALQDFNKAILLSPQGMAYINRGVSKFYLQDTQGACNDWHQAVALGFPQAKELIIQYCSKVKL